MIEMAFVILALGAVNALIPLLIVLVLIAAAAGLTRGFSIFNLFGIGTLLGIGVGAKAGITGKSGLTLPFMSGGRTFSGRGINPGKKKINPRIRKWRAYRKETAPTRKAARTLKRAEKIIAKGGVRMPRTRNVLSNAKNAFGSTAIGSKILSFRAVGAIGTGVTKVGAAGVAIGTGAGIAASKVVTLRKNATQWKNNLKAKALNPLRISKPPEPPASASAADMARYKEQLRQYHLLTAGKYSMFALGAVLVPGLAVGVALYGYSKLGRENVKESTSKEYTSKVGGKLRGILYIALPPVGAAVLAKKGLMKGAEKLHEQREETTLALAGMTGMTPAQRRVAVAVFKSDKAAAKIEELKPRIGTTVGDRELTNIGLFTGKQNDRFKAANFITVDDLASVNARSKTDVQRVANRVGITYVEARNAIRKAQEYNRREGTVQSSLAAHLSNPTDQSYLEFRKALKEEYYSQHPVRSIITGSAIRGVSRAANDFYSGFSGAAGASIGTQLVAGFRGTRDGIISRSEDIGTTSTSNPLAVAFVGAPRRFGASLSSSFTNIGSEIKNRPTGESVAGVLVRTAVQPEVDLIRETYHRGLALIPEIPDIEAHRIGRINTPRINTPKSNYPHLHSSPDMYATGLEHLTAQLAAAHFLSPRPVGGPLTQEQLREQVKRSYTPGQIILEGQSWRIEEERLRTYERLRNSVIRRGHTPGPIH